MLAWDGRGRRTKTPKSLTGQVEILVLRSGHADALMQLSDEISRDAASANFHPHPFDAEWTERICRYQVKTTSLRLTERNSSVLWTLEGGERRASCRIRIG